MSEFKKSIAYQYAYSVANELEPKGTVGIYVKKQCEDWLKIADGLDETRIVDEKEFEKINGLLKIMRFPDDPTKTIHEALTRYGWLFIIATLCTKLRNDTSIRAYKTSVLEICRKNFKTFNAAIVFIIGMLTEKNFSRLFSVAPNYKLSCELMLAVRKIIKVSPDLKKRFKINNDLAECKLTDITYIPLAYSNDSLDGRLAAIFLADECGLLDDYPIEAMRSSQITLRNKLGILVSTQYPNNYNVFMTEIDYAKRVLDNIEDDKEVFALLYEPDEEIREDWKTNDNVIYQSNPVAVDMEFVFEEIIKKRKQAILYSSKKENYLNKHNNIHYIGGSSETFISSDELLRCGIKEIDWTGRNVYLGLDLAETDDNTGISMLTYDSDEDIIYCKSVAIIPADKVLIKSKKENIDYEAEIENGNCFTCGEDVIDYNFIYEYILGLEEKYKVKIIQFGYDIRNARATAQTLRNQGLVDVEVKQHSSVLHAPIKLLKEYILNGKFKYEENKLLDINFLNCRQTEDTNLNKYLNKKKSVGKIDMVMSIVDALYLLQENEMLSEDWAVQTT